MQISGESGSIFDANQHALASLFVTGCSQPPPQSPRLRITNSGEHDIADLVVIFPGSRIEVGDVPAGVTSDDKDAPGGVYGYGHSSIAFRVRSLRQRQLRDDTMGASPMPDASYTFVIEFVPDRFPRGELRHTAVLHENDVIFRSTPLVLIQSPDSANN